MSAIWGHISFDGNIWEQINDLMCRAYQRKCKLDKIQEYRQNNFYVGCGLQYITEESRSEVLPIFDAERQLCFTADCILDNRQELLEKLHITDKRLPDGTLMYQAFLKWGTDCFAHFRGLFSIAVYDKNRRVLYLASDQTASRCLYYYQKEEKVTFSTLIEPIRTANPEISRNDLYLKDFVTAPGLMPNIVSTETPYEGIYKLNPGTWLAITQDGIEEHSYWALDRTAPAVTYRTAREYGKHFRKLYEVCVADALRTDQKVGIAMSSGLDSASVGALAADMLVKEGKTLYSYTYVPYEKELTSINRNFVLDEREDVRKIAAMHPNIETSFLNNQGKNCYEELDSCIDKMEIPFKAYVNFPNLIEIYEQAAKIGCKVVLSGQMGNASVSHGYIDDDLYELYKNKKYVTFLRNLNQYSKTVKESRKAALRGCIRYFKRTDEVYAKQEFQYEPDNPFLNEHILEDYPLRERYEAGEVTSTEKVAMGQKQHQEFMRNRAVYTYMGEYETKLGLASGVIVRDPTKDVRMLEFCYHLPYEIFAHKGVPRWLIRGNMQDVLPNELLDNWMRYGVQNPDWFMRMMRDWDTLQACMTEDVRQEKMARYINAAKTLDGIREIQSQEEETAQRNLLYLMHLCVLSRFLQKG